MSKILKNVVQKITIQDISIPPEEYTELFHFFQIILAITAPIHYEFVNNSSATELYPNEPPQLALALTHNKRYERNFNLICHKLKGLIKDLDNNTRKILFKSDLYEKLSQEIYTITMLLDDEHEELMRFYYEEIVSRQLSDDDPEIGMFRALCQMVKEQVDRYSPRSLNRELPELKLQYQNYKNCFSPRFDKRSVKTGGQSRLSLITPDTVKHQRRRSIG